MSTNRQVAEEYIIKHMKLIDPTGTNAKRYSEMFSKMSDKMFDQFMNDLESNKASIYVMFPNMIIPMEMKNILKTADSLGVKVCERITRRDPITGKTYTTPNEYLILKLPSRRTRQYLAGKRVTPGGDTRIDALTGQVVKPDKAATLSYVETQLLHTKGLPATIEELMHVRGGDAKKYAQFKRQLEETGEASLNAIDQNSVSRSTVTASVILNGMMLSHNLIEGQSL